MIQITSNIIFAYYQPSCCILTNTHVNSIEFWSFTVGRWRKMEQWRRCYENKHWFAGFCQ